MLRNKSGITLIGLVITIIVLLVLAGVVFNLSMGENGIISKAKIAVGKYENARVEEDKALVEMTNRGTITLTQEQFDALKPKKIDKTSLIFEASNSTATAGTYTLANWTKTYKDNYNEYFTYNNENSKMICKKEGWYLINMEISDGSENSSSQHNFINCYVNDILVSNCRNTGSNRAVHTSCTNSLTVYLYKDDVVYIEKVLSNWATYSNNNIKILHL